MPCHHQHHQSTHSNTSTYPLPSLCSSISSYNSSSKSLPLQKSNIICGENAEDVSALANNNQSATNNNNNNNNNKNSEQQQQQQQRKRWDESQFAIELCDDSYKSICSHSNSNHSSTTKGLKDKLRNSKLFHQSQISGKLSSLLRKIKSL